MKSKILLLTIFLAACASKTPAPEPPKAEAPPPQAAATESQKESAPPEATSPPAPEAPALPAVKSGVEPKQSLHWLEDGNLRFLNRRLLRRDGQSKKDIARVAAAERPHAIVFAPSDSRMPPEILFDQKLGEIYVVRTAGLTIDVSVIASLEFALKDLGPRLIVVLGLGNEVKDVAEELSSRSSFIHAAVGRGQVWVKPAVYDLETGKIKFLD